METYSSSDDCDWVTVNTDGNFTTAKERISYDVGTLTLTLNDADGQGRTLLTLDNMGDQDASNDVLNGQWQKLATDNVTFYEGYETWISTRQ